jgi:cell division septal protein FtsQ
MNLRTRVIALSILIFAGLVYLFAWSSIFSVKTIEVSGLPAGISAQTIISKSDIAIREKLARIEPRATEKKLSELSWIKKVDVNRNWIHGSVLLKVQGRVAVGIFQGKALDASGTIFEYPGKLPSGLPVVRASTPTLGLKAIALFTGLPSELRDQVLSMTAYNESSISSVQQLSGRTVTVRWGAAEQIPLKVSVYQALIALPENKKIVRIDLSAPHAPIVK